MRSPCARRRPQSEMLIGLLPQGFDPGGRLVVFENGNTMLLDPSDHLRMSFPFPKLPREFPVANKLRSISLGGRYQGLVRNDLRTIDVWDRRLGKRLYTIPSISWVFSFAEQSGLVMTFNTNNVSEPILSAWELSTGKLNWKTDVSSFLANYTSRAFEGDYIAMQKGTNLQVSRLEGTQIEEVMQVPVHQWLSSAAVSPDGRLLATAIGDITLRTVPDGEIVGVLKGHTRKTVYLAFSPDGRTLGSIADDQTTRLWSVATHRELLRFPASAEGRGAFQVEFSHDGRALACYRHDGTNAVTSLYFAPSLAEIAIIEGGDYRTAAGDNAATWFHVARELLRQDRPEEAWEACVRSQTLAEARDDVKWWLEPSLQLLRVEILRRLGRIDEAGRENVAF